MISEKKVAVEKERRAVGTQGKSYYSKPAKARWGAGKKH